MKKLALVAIAIGALMFTTAPPALGESIVWHDPYLNWDLTNWTGGNINDLAIIVDNPNGLFNPNLNDPAQIWADIFQTVTLFPGDYDGDGDQDVMVKYSNPPNPVANGETAHGGIYMYGSGRVIDAYWTLDCSKVGSSIPVTYEQTEIRGDPEIHMHLNINPGFFEDGGTEAGWTEIRTFINIPAAELSLSDLNKTLNLDTLVATYGGQEVTPEYGQPGIPGTAGVQILQTDVNMQGVPDSFFDVFLAQIPQDKASPDYESLLVATVVVPNPLNANENIVHGQFWNLNPQSPEPATVSLLALGACLALFRRRARLAAAGRRG